MRKHNDIRVLSPDEVSERRRRKLNKTVSKVIIFAILLFYAILLLLPFYTIIITSVTSNIEKMSQMSFIWFPEEITFDAYKNVLEQDPVYLSDGISSIAIGFFNTLWTTILTCVVGLFMSGLAAFAYAKLKFKGRDTLFLLQLVTIMIPMATMTIPSFIFYESIGWTNTFLPIVVPGLFGGATTIFFLKSYIMSIPDEIIEAAKIDGLGPVSTYVRIIIPLSIPAYVAQFIFGFVGGYNNYQKPLLYLSGNEKLYTLQLSLNILQGYFSRFSNQLCAIAVIGLIPLLIVYIIFQRFFIEGIAVGGGKE
jgi:multiple sugar transport system permease protein